VNAMNVALLTGRVAAMPERSLTTLSQTGEKLPDSDASSWTSGGS
jgi:hypothetical protein